MNLPHDLTIPREGSTTLRELLGPFLRALLRKLDGVLAGRGSPDTAAVRRVVGELVRREPGRIFSLLRQPTISVLVQCAHGSTPPPSPWVDELCGLIAFELALAGGLERPLRLARPPRILSSPAHGIALELDAGALVFTNGRVATERAGALDLAAPADAPGIRVLRPYHPVRGFVLAERDNNPLSMFEAHPEKSGNAVDLGGRPAAEWASVLGESYDLVRRYAPALADEMDLLLRQVVPVGWHTEKHLSASYREAVGTIYLTLHPNLLTMAEALVHEFQHNKLNLLSALDPMLENAFSPLFASPVRPDPRPLHGILLAVHAFQPIAHLYEEMERARDPRLERPDVRRRWADVMAKNHQGATELLRNAKPTAVGRALLDEIARWDRYYEALRPRVGAGDPTTVPE